MIIQTIGLSKFFGLPDIGDIECEFGTLSKGADRGEMHAFYGQKHTEESKELMRKARAGKKPALGMKHTPEVCAAIGERSRGKKMEFTAEHRANISKAAKNRVCPPGSRKPLSPEHRQKISERMKGNNNRWKSNKA